MINLYLYVDNLSFSDYFSTSSISCDKLIPNKKGVKTIARKTQNFLFLTHLKINEQSRFDGIFDRITGWPVTLECNFDSETYEKIPAVFVKGSPQNYILESGDIAHYDITQHIGCFILAEIPFSSIRKIFFETKTQLEDSNKSIFSDFLWREDLVDILNQNDFIDAFTYPEIDESQINKYVSFPIEEAMFDRINKYRAAILQLINGTRAWKTGKYRTTFDSVLLDYFSINEKTVKDILISKQMPVPDEIFSSSAETITLIPIDNAAKNSSVEQQVYNLIIDSFISNKETCNPNNVHLLLNQIKTSVSQTNLKINQLQFSEVVDSIESCYLNKLGATVDDILTTITKLYSDNSVLKALLFVIKNPSEFDKFILSLDLYKADAITARRAMVLWGFLNGICGIPAKGFQRENVLLWISIEWKHSKLFPFLPQVKEPLLNITSPYGIEIKSEEIITFEEIHTFFASDKNHLTKGFLENVYSIAKTCNKKLSKEDPYSTYDFYGFCSQLLSLIPPCANDDKKRVGKTEFKAFDKDFLKKYKNLSSRYQKNAILDYEAIYKDWILNSSNFKRIWDVMEDKIISYYISRRR